MTNVHLFPLLQLPFLALEHVINQMFIKEQFLLSTVSKRAQWVVKTGTSRQRYIMTVTCSDTVEVDIRKSKSVVIVRTKLNPNGMAKFIPMTSGAFKNLSINLCILNNDSYRSIFELFEQLSVSLNDIYISSWCPNDELCQIRLRLAAKGARQLIISLETSPNFKPYDLGECDLELLDIRFARWVTSEILANHFMNCTAVELMSSEMTINDLNSFFKKWVAGSRMKSFRWRPDRQIPGGSILPMVLEGISCVAVKKAKIPNVNIKEFASDTCFMIEQIGGVTALVHGFHEVRMTTEYSMDGAEESGND